MADFQPGDRVQVLSGASIVAETGLSATIVRRMTDADDYEVEFDGEQPGVSPIVHPDRLLLASVAQGATEEAAETPAEEAVEAPAAEPPTETAEPAEATPDPAQDATEAPAEVPATAEAPAEA